MKLRTFVKSLFDGNNAIQIYHIIFFIFVVCLTPKTGFWFDLHDWSRWSVYTFEHGLSKIYESDTNYMPFYLHSLYFFGQIQGSVKAIEENIYQIKYFFLLFDFGAAIAISHSLRKYNIDKMSSFLLLFNIAYLYETVIWGQLDSLPTTVVVLAFITLLQGRVLWAAFFCTLSIYVKLQTIIFIPFFVLILFFQFYKEINRKLIFQMLIISLLTQVWMLLPFILNNSFDNFLKVVRESVGFFPRVSWSAYNFWYLILPDDPTQIFDNAHFVKLTYHKWGLILFFIFSGLGLLPLMIQTWQYAKQKLLIDKAFLVNFWLTAGIISIVFFYFNTEMHERYAFPAMAMYFAYALLTGRYVLYILVSAAHLINIDGIYQFLHPSFLKPEVISGLYILILGASFYEIYKNIFLSFRKVG